MMLLSAKIDSSNRGHIAGPPLANSSGIFTASFYLRFSFPAQFCQKAGHLNFRDLTFIRNKSFVSEKFRP
jgi:hypothetical protein